MTARLRVLVADDEPAAREKLVRLLSAHADVEIVGEAATGLAAVEAIKRLGPDVVMLDVRMPEMDGFEVLDALGRGADEPAPKIIFVTAFDQYAVQAFEVRAFDYLLKPFDAARLTDALGRLRDHLDFEYRPSRAALGSMFQQLAEHGDATATPQQGSTGYLSRVCLKSVGRVEFVRLADVEWIEACGNYVRLHTGAGHPLLRERLHKLVDQLDPAQFCRIHRSAVVNLDRVREMRPRISGDYIVRLESGTRLRLSRSYRKEVDRRLGRR